MLRLELHVSAPTGKEWNRALPYQKRKNGIERPK